MEMKDFEEVITNITKTSVELMTLQDKRGQAQMELDLIKASLMKDISEETENGKKKYSNAESREAQLTKLLSLHREAIRLRSTIDSTDYNISLKRIELENKKMMYGAMKAVCYQGVN